MAASKQTNGIHCPGQRLTFPFPFVHHQLHDRKVGQLLTVETRTHGRILKKRKEETDVGLLEERYTES